MVKYLPVILFLIVMANCGRPERKLTNIKKKSADTLVIVQQTGDDVAMHENRFDVEKISGKSKEEIAQYLGEPSSQEKVTVKGDISNCDKVSYVDGLVEVIFIKDKADWIKINDDPEMVLIPSKNNYVSVEKFPDYIFVKTFTK
ncbi:MAG TPA: hypothetical protein VNW99_04750 [Cytophagaceae bacterium]|jgi:hypothetical protein|nr:hypothetical protein [Cytophagaceae bacterium]